MKAGVFIGMNASSSYLVLWPRISIRMKSVIAIMKWGVPYKKVLL